MAVFLDGVDDRYDLANESTLRYEYTQPFSGHCWIKKDTVSSFCIMGKAQISGPQRGWAFNTEIISGNLGISFHLVNTGGTAHAFAQGYLLASGRTSAFQPGLWVPVGFTYTGSGLTSGFKLYINGSLVTIEAGAVDTLGGATIRVDGVAPSIGAFTPAPGEWWAGSVCGVVIVPATLTAAEMADLADVRNLQVHPNSFLSSGAADVWLPLAAGGEIDLSDYSGNGHNASVGSGAPALEPDPVMVLDTFLKTDFTTTTSYTYTPNSDVTDVAVLIAQNVSSADLITGVTYGGVAMRRLPTDGFAQDTAGEPGAAYVYVLNENVPQGAQTVAITVASGTDAKSAWVVSMNSRYLSSIVATGKVQGDTANPSVTLATPAGWVGIALNVCFSGRDAPANLTAGSGYVKLGGGRDFGSQSAVAEISNLDGASAASGWTSLSDDVAMIALALTALFKPRHPATDLSMALV